MKKKASKRPSPPMRAEYDLSGGVRGKYASLFEKGTNVVVIAPEIAEFFPDSAAVNAALRALVQIAKHNGRQKRRS